MEVAHPPPRVFLMPHQFFYDRSMRPTRSAMDMEVDHDHVVVDDDSAPASFTAWLMSGGVAAAASAVASLPETTAAAAGEDSCAVCLEGYAAGDALRTMPCAHAFHARCIVDWLSVSSSCPLCRFRLPTQAEEDYAAQHQQASRRG